MKKPSLIIGKKQIILTCLTLMLAIAVYINYTMSGSELETADLEPQEVTYGDTAFVNAQAEPAGTVVATATSQESDDTAATTSTIEPHTVSGAMAESISADQVAADVAAAENPADYFAKARLDRATSRDESVATLQSILGGGDRTQDELVVDAIAAVETTKLIESESTIESLIRAMGYADCIVYLDSESAKVVVQTEGLDAAGAAAIKDAILGEAAIAPENIRIYEVK